MKYITFFKQQYCSFIQNKKSMPNKKHLAKYALISTLKSSRPEARAHLIGYLNDSDIKLLSEAVFNVLFNNLSLSKREKSRMRKMYQSKERTFKNIGKKHNSIKRRRRLLQQHGSNLGPLLSIAARLFGHS